MVTKYDVISTRCSSPFLVNLHVFLTSFNDKSQACGYNDAKYLFINACLLIYDFKSRRF